MDEAVAWAEALPQSDGGAAGGRAREAGGRLIDADDSF